MVPDPAEPILGPRIVRVVRIKFQLFFPGFWPNPGPGSRPLDSGRRDAEIACVFASVAFLTVSFVRKSMFWNPVQQKKIKVRPSNGGMVPDPAGPILGLL